MSTVIQPDTPTTPTRSSQQTSSRRRHPRRPKSQHQAAQEIEPSLSNKIMTEGPVDSSARAGVLPVPVSSLSGPEVVPKRKNTPRKIKRKAALTGTSVLENNKQALGSRSDVRKAASGQVASAESSAHKSTEVKGKEPVAPLTLEEKAAIKAASRAERLQLFKQKNKQAKAQAKAKRKKDHFNLVLAAAKATIAALRAHEMSCAVFGSLACSLYGDFRQPKVRLFPLLFLLSES